MDFCLEQGAHCLQMVQLIPLHPQTPAYLGCPENRPLNGCSVVVVAAAAAHTHTPV